MYPSFKCRLRQQRAGISLTRPRLVTTSKIPRVRTNTRPTCVPAAPRWAGHTALTKSPVWKPLTQLGPLAFPRGKPYSSTLTICRRCLLVAVISQGRTPRTESPRGVEAPQQAASIQCALGRSRLWRFHFVSAPEPVSRGKPNALRRSQMAHRVLLTAAASFRGALRCACTRASTCGRSRRKSSRDRCPLAILHARQATTRLATRSLPPRLRGVTWSTSRGTPLAEQYAHRCSHLASKNWRTSTPHSVPRWYWTPSTFGFCNS